MCLIILITLEKKLQDVALPNKRMFIPFGSLYDELKSTYNVCVYALGHLHYVCCFYILVSTLICSFSRFLFVFWCHVIRHREFVFPLEVCLWFIYMSHLLLVFLCSEESHLTLDILVS